MGALFSSPTGIRPPPPPPPPPKSEDAPVQEAKAEALARRRRARGFRATIIAQRGPSPDANDAGLKQTFGA